jgi:hypothetical protein
MCKSRNINKHPASGRDGEGPLVVIGLIRDRISGREDRFFAIVSWAVA